MENGELGMENVTDACMCTLQRTLTREGIFKFSNFQIQLVIRN